MFYRDFTEIVEIEILDCRDCIVFKSQPYKLLYGSFFITRKRPIKQFRGFLDTEVYGGSSAEILFQLPSMLFCIFVLIFLSCLYVGKDCFLS